ncbi:TonB-dependent receptor [Tunturibacter empetritectus]|uniref:TonB-dependent receptor n=1 Tax=Tunturiibacter empetritectus TaxID=3069691 RepID=A0AAU7ZEY3_9BACT
MRFTKTVLVLLFVSSLLCAQELTTRYWGGTLQNETGASIDGATIRLVAKQGELSSKTSADGSFQLPNPAPGDYMLEVTTADGILHRSVEPLKLKAGSPQAIVTLSAEGAISVVFRAADAAKTGGEKLSSQTVSAIPLNKRDFSQLLLLAAGTMTDANGQTNFTQQFAINGQRGVEAVFAMDGADTSDPEMGGATFSNFNVDAVQEIQSTSGWMPAEIGRGAAGFTNITTRSGSSGFHGSVFEFLRNSALDARNYFDHPSIAEPGRIPPFRRNEFGFTNGGPIILPHLYDGSGKTFYFGQYQGFRQVLGTTQVLPVPTASERLGIDTTAFPGDTLVITPKPEIAKILSRYPLPNNPTGSYGANTYAASSKVVTNANQFSVRIDQVLSPSKHLTARFNFNNLFGPTTNPDQTAIDPSFGVVYVDHQRNGVLTYNQTVSPRFSFESSISVTRTTPQFPTPNHTDPAVKFNDGLFEAFNSAAGSVASAYGNLFQARQNFVVTIGRHLIKAGGEFRANRDTTYFGTSPNGEYDFGGGTAYSPVDITSQSGAHNIRVGDPLPDTLSGLLTGSAFVYTRAVAAPYVSGGDHIGPAAVSRNGGAIYAQDTFKISDRVVLDYGVRYEIYSPIAERAHRTSGFLINGSQQQYLVNPQPGYHFDWGGIAPRVQVDWKVTNTLHLHAGGGITTIPPNIWQDNFLTGAVPFVIYPHITAAVGAPILYGFQITSAQLPTFYTPTGQNVFASGNTKSVPSNTVLDVERYQRDLAALSPGAQFTPLNLTGIDRHFGNGYLQTWTLGAERQFGKLTADAAYVGTASVKLPRTAFPNSYSGASPEFATHTQFDGSGNAIGGFGTEQLIVNNAHSSYHSLQTSLTGTPFQGGPGIQLSYTWSKSIDDTSGVTANGNTTGAISNPYPQNPFNTHAEKGPSSFDVTHGFTMSLAQDLQLEKIELLQPINRKVTAGWELLSISTISSGLPFTVYSGVQQTGAGSNGVDRPNQIAKPTLSTARKVREDYFGQGANNASFFSIPINQPGGTGPNQGFFGSLGRDTFRGPAYYDFDFSLIKDTPVGRRAGGSELFDVEFRSEFFNLFNIVDMGLPANTIKGSGFGVISKTAGTSRQIQFSVKLLF